MGKLFCPNCGKEVEDTWKTCPYCGFDLTTISKESESSKENKDVSTEKQTSPPQAIPQGTNANPTPKKSNKGMIAAIVAVSVIVTILLALVLWQGFLVNNWGANSSSNSENTGSIQIYYHSVLHNNIYIYLDGKYMGEYPSDTYITLNNIAPGTHTVRATTTGGTYLDEKTVTVYAGETTNVELSYQG